MVECEGLVKNILLDVAADTITVILHCHILRETIGITASCSNLAHVEAEIARYTAHVAEKLGETS